MRKRKLEMLVPIAHPRPSLAQRLTGMRTKFGLRQALWGWAFASPWVLGLVLFTIGPMIFSLYLSFTEYDVLSPAKWVGLRNYQTAFLKDALFWPSLGRTFYYALVAVPLGLVASLALAILLNQGLRATNIFRTMFFLPSMTPAVATVLIWLWLMNPKIGILNLVLSKFGFPADFPWYTDKHTVIPSLIVMNLWTSAGSNTMLVFLAALQGVPSELYEAAEIDGAGPWDKFRNVTLPQISPALLFNLVLGVIGALQVFTSAFVATTGGPAYGSWFFALHIYQQAFQYYRMGYGTALAWIFLVVVLVLTLVNIKLSDRWVYYGGGE